MDEKNILLEQINTLPEDLQDIILDDETKKLVVKIGNEAGLSDEQNDLFIEEVFITLIGSSNPIYFRSNLVKNGITPVLSEKLEKEVTEKIFAQVQPQLDEIYSDRNDEKNEVTTENKTVTEIMEARIQKPEQLNNLEKDDYAESIARTHGFYDDKETPEHKIEKDNILHEIETPKITVKNNIPTNLPTEEKPKEETRSIFDQKVQDFYRAPKKQNTEDIEIQKEKEDEEVKTPPESQDPYREQVK